MILLVTPSQAQPLLVRDRAGQVIRTDSVGSDCVMVLISAALPHWLLAGTPSADMFHTAPHGVPALPPHLHHRTVLARMKVRQVT